MSTISSPSKPMVDPGSNTGAITQYYRFHSKIYDATRWSFLFGRAAIIKQIAATSIPTQILEVGCGTGKNLIALAHHFPQASITGVDVSADMLAVTRQNLGGLNQRVTLIQEPYIAPIAGATRYDLILFSYALTMFNPGWETALTAAHADLSLGGTIAVVDFHDSPLPLFKRWMGVNHVRMDSHLRPWLMSNFTPQTNLIHAAYGGLWHYLLFLGRKLPLAE
jgi:S-adenosylmethionine-diacylgycerolhomoserine-N-methlytransferase